MALFYATIKTDSVSFLLSYVQVIDDLNPCLFCFSYSGEIFSLIQFDREKVSDYYITVAAQDNGGRMGFATVHVRITDQNDNLPQFTMHDYKACIFANASEGSEIIQVCFLRSNHIYFSKTYLRESAEKFIH